MEKFSGRFYVSCLIVVAIMDAINKSVETSTGWALIGVPIHLVCLFFVIKDGVK